MKGKNGAQGSDRQDLGDDGPALDWWIEKGCPLTTEGGSDGWRDKEQQDRQDGGRRGVEHEANKASKWEDDGVLRQYLRMRSRLWGYPNSLKRGKNDGF